LDNLIWATILVSTFKFANPQNAIFLSASYLVAYCLNTIIILPIYFKKKLVPKRSIASFEALILWLLLFGASYIGVTSDNYLIKSFLFLFLVISSSLLFNRLSSS
jgi:uncharacterized membrane protein YfcA